MNQNPLQYDFVAPQQVVFGWGRRSEAGGLARRLGERAWIVCGSRTLSTNGTLDALQSRLRAAGVEPVLACAISHEPLVSDVDQAVEHLRSKGAGRGDLLLAIGGGSAIDLAKAVAALLVNPEGKTVDYLEGVGRGLTLSQEPLPVLAMPTTSGTGSEATKNAVISSYEPAFKKSLRADGMVPRIVIIDPELTVSLPPLVTAWTGMDAITQLIESYISRKAQPIPQALALHGLELAIPSVLAAFQNPEGRRARERMAHAAFLSGQALANSGLGMAHGVAAALGVHCRVPHGLACAIMLPAALRMNQEVRLAELARLAPAVTERTWTDDRDAVRAMIDTIDELCDYLRVPRRLGELGVRADQHADLVRSSRGNSMSGNPREITDAELLDLLREMQ